MALSPFDLTGRTALVTGAGRGLGQAIALALAQAGARVGIASRTLASLDETEALIAAAGGQADRMVLDVTDIGAIEGAFAAQAGAVDILVNNAGYEEVRPSLEVDEALWDRISDTNLKGAFFCAQAAARSMISGARGGSIVNICSLTSYVGVPTAVPYGSSKSGLLGMTRALSAEWAPQGIRVNGIAPGYFRTAMTEPFYQNAGWRESMLDKIPMRQFGDPADLGGAVVFLASGASRYVTGQCIAVDGGYLAGV